MEGDMAELSDETLAYFESKYDDLEQDEATGALPTEPDIAQEQEAERHLRAVAYWRGKLAHIEAHAEAERMRIDQWCEMESRKIERRIQWHEGGLFVFLQALGKSTWKGIYGTIKRISGRERIDVLQAEVFQDWAEKTGHKGLLRVKVEPDKQAIGAWIKGHSGELPPGVDIVVGSDTYKVNTT